MITVVDRFAPREARALRAAFDARFADPRRATADRFVWDYWHVPNQYTALRTPAWTYFPKGAYRAFHARLVAWGRRVLGCHDLSPPWLSCYVEGCEQRLHGDLPHGPFAFVFSITPEPRAFRGGETLVVKDEILDFWDGFESIRSIEEPHILKEIAPRFGRLVVFDPRLPHGVREVRGARDPREGRLVVHGWFVSPRPFIEGALSRRALTARIEDLALPELLRDAPPMAGVLTMRVNVAKSGRAKAEILVDTTRTPRAQERARLRAVRRVVRAIGAMDFGAQRAGSRVTLPIVFER